MVILNFAYKVGGSHLNHVLHSFGCFWVAEDRLGRVIEDRPKVYRMFPLLYGMKDS